MKWEVKRSQRKFLSIGLGNWQTICWERICCMQWRRELTIGSPCEGKIPGANILKKEVETICLKMSGKV